MKATEQYFPVVLFTVLYTVVLAFETVVEILWCDHLNKSYWGVLSCVAVTFVYYAVQLFESVDEIQKYDHPFSFIIFFSFHANQNCHLTFVV